MVMSTGPVLSAAAILGYAQRDYRPVLAVVCRHPAGNARSEFIQVYGLYHRHAQITTCNASFSSNSQSNSTNPFFRFVTAGADWFVKGAWCMLRLLMSIASQDGLSILLWLLCHAILPNKLLHSICVHGNDYIHHHRKPLRTIIKVLDAYEYLPQNSDASR